MRRLAILTFFFLLLPAPVRAIEEAVYSTETFNNTFVFPNIGTFAPTPENGLAWDAFAATLEIPKYGKDNLIESVSVAFSKKLKAQNGKNIKMRGYMFPLESTANQTRFLFGPFPVTCPHHFHTPPTLVIEVTMAKAIPFTYDAVVLEGVLRLDETAAKEPYHRLEKADLGDASESLVSEGTPPAKSLHPLFHKRMNMP